MQLNNQLLKTNFQIIKRLAVWLSNVPRIFLLKIKSNITNPRNRPTKNILKYNQQ